jgi:arylsulfatase A-like enzyme
MRVPAIAWWPGRIKAGTTTAELAANLDLFPTLVLLAGAGLPADRVLDGFDLAPVLFGSGKSARQAFFYYRDTRLFAVRSGAYKAHFTTQTGYGPDSPERHDPPALYQLKEDPSERFDVAKDHPDVIADIQREVAAHRATMKPAENQLEKVKK